MNLSISKGTRQITATKPEIKALRAGADVLEAYIGVSPNDVDAAKALETQRRIIGVLDGEEVQETPKTGTAGSAGSVGSVPAGVGGGAGGSAQVANTGSAVGGTAGAGGKKGGA